MSKKKHRPLSTTKKLKHYILYHQNQYQKPITSPTIEYFHTSKSVISGNQFIYDKLNVFISKETKFITTKGLFSIINNILDAKRIYHINDEDMPVIIVFGVDEYTSCLGVYKAIENELYINEICGYNNKLKLLDLRKGYTEFHEMWHLVQAIQYKTNYGPITKTNLQDYYAYTNATSKLALDHLGINKDNVSKISDYALRSYIYEDFNEVVAEIKGKTKGKSRKVW